MAINYLAFWLTLHLHIMPPFIYKKTQPLGGDLLQGLTQKIEVLSSVGSRKDHDRRLSRMCHWQRERACRGVSRCNHQWTTHFQFNITASALFLLRETRESNSPPAGCTAASLPLCSTTALRARSSYINCLHISKVDPRLNLHIMPLLYR